VHVLINVVVIGFFIGTILGSFVLALADRSLTKKSFGGRSYCPSCKHSLRWYDLFPILSYLQLLGKCRYCKKKIGIKYPLVEVTMGVLVGFLFYQQFSIINFHFSINFQLSIFILELILKIFFITVLAVVFITDYRKMFIPDRIILPSIVTLLIFSSVLVIVKIGYLYYYLSQHNIGKYLLPPFSDYFQRHAFMVLEPFIYSILMGATVASFFFGLIVITRGKGMGGGDVKLGGFLGLMLGFPLSLVALFASFLIGAIFSVLLIVMGKKHFGQTIAFGPFLVIGSLIALFWGNKILNWYLGLTI